MNKFFENVNKNFGFGMMRLPMKGNEVDFDQVNIMVDEFINSGFNYFDTAHGYIDGQSEIAVNKCLASRYSRDKFILTNKLTEPYFKKEEDIYPFFESQLKICGVEYFDFYLMHAQNARNFEHFKKYRAYEAAFKLKEEGKIKHVGISFHDKVDVLEKILTEYPQIEVVQIQYNYLDYNDDAIQSKKLYELCKKYNKPVIVMEPVRGGSLVNLPNEAKKVFDSLSKDSYASFAIRFAATGDQMMMVLSGMSDINQMRDNISYMKDFKPINDVELEAINKVVEIFNSKNMIACTSCRYCTAGCPKNIDIPNLFSCYNSKKLFNSWNADFYYETVHTANKGKASDCIKCGKCERICPQNLPIRKLLELVKEEFESKKEN